MGAELLSEWHKSRCSSESRGKSQRLKFSRASTSETQSKWLVERNGSEGEVELPDPSSWHHPLVNIVTQHKRCYLTYRFLFSDAGQWWVLKVQTVTSWSQWCFSNIRGVMVSVHSCWVKGGRGSKTEGWAAEPRALTRRLHHGRKQVQTRNYYYYYYY